jgi:hypothetical protein
MYRIETISDYESLDADQKVQLLKALKVKKRLETYLLARASKKAFEPYSRDCEHCYGGKVIIRPRDDSGIHPSGVFGCVQALWYCAADYVYEECDYNDQASNRFEARMHMLFEWGGALHKTLQGFGIDGAWCDPEQYHHEVALDPETNPVAADLWIKGHADARIDNYLVEDVPTIGDVSVRMIHEYKSMKQEKFDKQMAPKPEHKWQATVYAGVLDVPIVTYLYVGKNTSHIQDFPVGFDRNIWDIIVAKIRLVQKLVLAWQRPHTRRTPAASDKTKYDCKQCKFFGICEHPKKTGATGSTRSARRAA